VRTDSRLGPDASDRVLRADAREFLSAWRPHESDAISTTFGRESFSVVGTCTRTPVRVRGQHRQGDIRKVNFPEEPSHATTTERTECDERKLEGLDTCVWMRSTFL